MECAIKARDCKDQPLNCPGIDVKYEPYPKGENIGNDDNQNSSSNNNNTNSYKNNSSGNLDNTGNNTNKSGAVETKKSLASLSYPE